MNTALDAYETQQAQRVGKLHAQAGGFSAIGQHEEAGAAHYERGMIHEKAGDYHAARDAFKAAADCFKRHAKGLADRLQSLDEAADCMVTPKHIAAWKSRDSAMNAAMRSGEEAEEDEEDEEEEEAGA